MPTLRAAIDSGPAKAGARDFEQSTRRMSNAARRADRRIGGLSSRFRGLRGVMSSVQGLAGGVFAGLAGAGIVGGAISNIASFEETMIRVRAVSGATERQFRDLNEVARELGATTRFSAQEAAEGQLFLARAGFDVRQSIAALPQVLDLATATQFDLGRSADVASNALRQFGLEAEQTARVTDSLVNVSNSANTSVEQLAQALNLVGPVANTVGLSIERTNALVGTLSDAGIQATRAGTSLRTVLLSLINPSGSAQKAMKSLGFEIEELNPITNDLVTVFDRLASVSQESFAQEAGAIFGRRGSPAAAILRENIENVRRLTKIQEENRGAASRQAEMVEQSLTQSFLNLKAAVVETTLAIGESGFTGAIRTTVDFITDIFRALAGMQDQLKNNRTLIQSITFLLETLARAAAFFLSFKLASFFATLAARLITARGAMTAFTASLAANPITAAAAALSLVGSAIFEIAQRSKQARQEMTSFQETLQDLISSQEQLLSEQGGRVSQRQLAQQRRIADTIRDQLENLRTLNRDLEGSPRLGQSEDLTKRVREAQRNVESLQKILNTDIRTGTLGSGGTESVIRQLEEQLEKQKQNVSFIEEQLKKEDQKSQRIKEQNRQLERQQQIRDQIQAGTTTGIDLLQEIRRQQKLEQLSPIEQFIQKRVDQLRQSQAFQQLPAGQQRAFISRVREEARRLAELQGVGESTTGGGRFGPEDLRRPEGADDAAGRARRNLENVLASSATLSGRFQARGELQAGIRVQQRIAKATERNKEVNEETRDKLIDIENLIQRGASATGPSGVPLDLRS